MADAGSLAVYLTANADKFNSALTSAETHVKKFSSSVGKGLMGLPGQLGVALSIGAIVEYGRRAIDVADAIFDNKKKLGVTGTEYQKLSYAAEQSGADMGNVALGFKKMSSTITDAGKGLQSAQDSLGVIGLTFEDLKGLSPEKQFSMIAERLNNISDSTEKAAYAQDLFGKTGMELIPMIQNYKELGDELERSGGIISDKTIEAADKFNDALNRINTNVRAGLLNSGLVEYLERITDALSATIDIQAKVKQDRGTGKYANEGGLMSHFGGYGEGEVYRTEGWYKYTGDNFNAEKANADRLKRIQDKKLADEKAAYTQKQLAERASNKLIEKEMDITAKQYGQVQNYISSLQDKLKYQELINAGKEREAVIEQAIASAREKAGSRGLLDSEIKSIRDIEGAIYDSTNKNQKGTVREMQFAGAMERGSMEAYSAEIGGKDFQKQIAQNTKTANDTLSDIKSGINNIAVKQSEVVDI